MAVVTEPLVKLMEVAGLAVDVGFAETKSEARRLMAGGGLRVDDVKVTDPFAHIAVLPDRSHIVISGAAARASMEGASCDD